MQEQPKFYSRLTLLKAVDKTDLTAVDRRRLKKAIDTFFDGIEREFFRVDDPTSKSFSYPGKEGEISVEVSVKRTMSDEMLATIDPIWFGKSRAQAPVQPPAAQRKLSKEPGEDWVKNMDVPRRAKNLARQKHISAGIALEAAYVELPEDEKNPETGEATLTLTQIDGSAVPTKEAMIRVKPYLGGTGKRVLAIHQEDIPQYCQYANDLAGFSASKVLRAHACRMDQTRGNQSVLR